MRILQICSSSATSGAERHVCSLSTQLVARGYHVEALTPNWGWLPQRLHDAGIPYALHPLKGWPSVRSLALVSRKIRKERIQVVHTHLTRAAYFGHMLGLITRVPIVTSVHIANNDLIYRRLAKRRNKLVAVSNFVRGMLHGRGINERYIETIYNGTDFTDIAPFSPDAVKEEMGVPLDRRLVGLVAKVCRDKGHVELLHAMRDVCRDHPTAHVVFVGRVEEAFQQELDDTLDSTGLRERVTVTGERHDVPRMLDALTLCTLPSKMETFGLAAIEAMAREKAVVASRVGALPEVVRHQQTGLLVDLRPEAIAEAVDYLLTHNDERDEMGRKGRWLVEQKFTLKEMVDRFERLYGATTA